MLRLSLMDSEAKSTRSENLKIFWSDLSTDTMEQKKRNNYIKNDAGHFVCPHCNIVKEKQNTMFYHLQTHEGKLPYECNICKKTFVQKQELALHKLRKHTQEQEQVDRTVCPFDDCDFADVRKGNVRIHCIRIHGREYISDDIIGRTDDGAFNCGLCGHTANSQTGLYYHLSTCLFDHGVISPSSEFARTMDNI